MEPALKKTSLLRDGTLPEFQSQIEAFCHLDLRQNQPSREPMTWCACPGDRAAQGNGGWRRWGAHSACVASDAGSAPAVASP